MWICGGWKNGGDMTEPPPIIDFYFHLCTPRGVILRKFEMIKTNYQQNEPNKISFNLFPKVSIKLPNLWFGAVRRNCEQVKRNTIYSCSQLLTANRFELRIALTFFFEVIVNS